MDAIMDAPNMIMVHHFRQKQRESNGFPAETKKNVNKVQSHSFESRSLCFT